METFLRFVPGRVCPQAEGLLFTLCPVKYQLEMGRRGPASPSQSPKLLVVICGIFKSDTAVNLKVFSVLNKYMKTNI